MLKVFLVEDEIVMREGIKNNVAWEKEGFDFVGEASDGELAYPMIQETKPDIVITDIKMPFMDGLELSRLIKKELPETKIIVLSGYDDFDYAKQAIGIGITDYLLKPISSAKLLEAVKVVAEKIQKERTEKGELKKFQQGLAEYELLERQCFFTDLMFHRMSVPEILERGRKLEIDLTARYYQVVLYKFIQPENKDFAYSQELVELTHRMQELFTVQEQVYAFERGTEGWVLLLKSDSEAEAEGLLRDTAAVLSAMTEGYKELKYFGGIGRRVQRLRELPESYDDANRAFSLRYLGELNRIVGWQEVQNHNILERETIDISSLDLGKIDRKVLESFLKGGGLLEEAAHFVEDYFTALGEEHIHSMMFRQYIAMDMYFCTAAFMESLGYDMERLTESCGDMKTMTGLLADVEATKTYLIQLISEAIRLRDQASMQKYSGMLNAAKQYIAENYDKEDICLNTVAASVNISPSHFSTIFSQEMGETFIEYLTRVRMEKAKELLRCSNKKSTEIGYAVGYKDPHYFSYLFKKTQECTPKEFRARKGSEGP